MSSRLTYRTRVSVRSRASRVSRARIGWPYGHATRGNELSCDARWGEWPPPQLWLLNSSFAGHSPHLLAVQKSTAVDTELVRSKNVRNRGRRGGTPKSWQPAGNSPLTPLPWLQEERFGRADLTVSGA